MNERTEKLAWSRLAHGAYLLRTNHPDEDPAALWRWYIQLTQAEAAFRTGKSDLHLRPIFHQTTERVEAHILVSFLSLALWRVLEQWMQSKGCPGQQDDHVIFDPNRTMSPVTHHLLDLHSATGAS